jgi:hypothetical protein
MRTKHVTNLVFVCQKDDSLALQSLNFLREKGYCIQILNEGETAPVGSVALYTGHNEQWSSRHLRAAAHRLVDLRPEWALTTPFVAALRKNRYGKVENAAIQLAQQYESWLLGESGVVLPWETPNGRQTSYKDLMESWLDLASGVLNPDDMKKVLASKILAPELKGRGGAVVLNNLSETGRVVCSPADLPKDLRGNDAYANLSKFTQPIVSYGTSDAANVFEFVQTLKLARYLGLPAVFETYPGSHNWDYWLKGFLNPSLSVFKSALNNGELGLRPQDKYTAILSSEKVLSVFPALGMEHIAEIAAKAADCPVWKWYQTAMAMVAEQLFTALGFSISYAFTTTEELCMASGKWGKDIREVAREVEKASGIPVVVLNAPDGHQFKTNDRQLPYKTIKQLHDEGFWLGGAAIYDLIFSLGRFGGVITMAKDSTAGRVNLLAKPYMSGDSGLYVCPVGLFRLSSEGQNEDWSVDPWVLLELLQRWGPEKACEELYKVWNSMEVPLARENIGRKTVATVSESGIRVRVSG